MIKIQLKDNCWLCLGLQQDCATCNGSGEVLTWITLDELTEQIFEIQKRNEEREKFPNLIETSTPFNMEDLEMPPNINI